MTCSWMSIWSACSGVLEQPLQYLGPSLFLSDASEFESSSGAYPVPVSAPTSIRKFTINTHTDKTIRASNYRGLNKYRWIKKTPTVLSMASAKYLQYQKQVEIYTNRLDRMNQFNQSNGLVPGKRSTLVRFKRKKALARLTTARQRMIQAHRELEHHLSAAESIGRCDAMVNRSISNQDWSRQVESIKARSAKIRQGISKKLRMSRIPTSFLNLYLDRYESLLQENIRTSMTSVHTSSKTYPSCTLCETLTDNVLRVMVYYHQSLRDTKGVCVTAFGKRERLTRHCTTFLSRYATTLQQEIRHSNVYPILLCKKLKLCW